MTLGAGKLFVISRLQVKLKGSMQFLYSVEESILREHLRRADLM